MSTKTELAKTLADAGKGAPTMLIKHHKVAELQAMVDALLGDEPHQMGVVLMNMRDGSVQGHAAGCGDLKRRTLQFAEPGQNAEVWDVATKAEAREIYNADFEETDGWYDITWMPCADHVPAGTDEEPKPTPAAPAQVPDSWNNPSYRDTFAKYLAAGGDPAKADAAMAALHAWQRATDRKGVANHVKLVQSRDFLVAQA